MAHKTMELKLVNSNYSKKEIEHAKAQEEKLKGSTDDKVTCPSWIKDKIARKEYTRILKELKSMEIVCNLDTNVLANYCIVYARYRQVTEALVDAPLLVDKDTKMGKQTIPNPLFDLQLKYSSEMDKLGSKMGLNILSRLKMVKPREEPKKENKFKKHGKDKK